MSRRLINQPFRLTIVQIIGAWMLVLGIMILLGIGIYDFFTSAQEQRPDISSLMAIGFFIIMLGMAFFFPDMLKSETKNSVSSMRVAVYMIVSVFIFLCVKIGWACTDFKDFQLDNSWAYLIGIALGSKALQTIGESGLPNKFKSNTSPDKSTFPNNFSALGRNSNNEIPLHDSTTIDTPPPTTPPPHIKINN